MLVPKEYDVIEEVINLLGRMESDRLSTQDTLVKERERVQKLRDQIDTQAYKRMHDLPLAVQRGKYSRPFTKGMNIYNVYNNIIIYTYIVYGFLTRHEAKMAGYWPSSFFACLWTETESRSRNGQKRMWPISSHLDQTSLVNKGLLYGFRGNFPCGTQHVVLSQQDTEAPCLPG